MLRCGRHYRVHILSFEQFTVILAGKCIVPSRVFTRPLHVDIGKSDYPGLTKPQRVGQQFGSAPADPYKTDANFIIRPGTPRRGQNAARQYCRQRGACRGCCNSTFQKNPS